MRKWLALLCAVMLSICPALADGADEAAVRQARQTLEAQGYPVSDEAAAMALEQHRMMQEWYAQASITADMDQTDWIYQLLLCEGVGEYDYDTLTFTPSSDRIYVFDAEFFNVGGMYTEFLQGVAAIMPEPEITAVREDLTGMNESLEGSRKVFFECSGHAYVKTLESQGDWFNPEIVDFLNHVLKVEGYEKQLHIVSDAYDQMVFLICGTAGEAVQLRRLLGVEAQQEPSLLDWLGNLLGM